MPNRFRSQHQLHHHSNRHHHHHHEQQLQQPSLHRHLSSSSSYSSSSFLFSIFLSVGCFATVFFASAIADPGSGPMRSELKRRDFPTRAMSEQRQENVQTTERNGNGSNASVTKSPAQQRQEKEDRFRKQIQKFILNYTGRNGSINQTTGDGYWERPTGRPSLPTRGSERSPVITHRIKEIADEVPNLTGVDGVVQFVLHPKKTSGLNGTQQVVSATMKVFVRILRPSEPSRPKQRHRFSIFAYLLDDVEASAAAAYGQNVATTADHSLAISQLNVVVTKTGWQKVLLPTTMVQRVLDSEDKVIRLRVVCVRCKDEVEVVVTPRRGGAGKKKTERKSARTGKPRRKGGNGSGRHPAGEPLLGGGYGDDAVTDRKSPPHLTPSGDDTGDGDSKKYPMLIVNTKTSSRSRQMV